MNSMQMIISPCFNPLQIKHSITDIKCIFFCHFVMFFSFLWCILCHFHFDYWEISPKHTSCTSLFSCNKHCESNFLKSINILYATAFKYVCCHVYVQYPYFLKYMFVCKIKSTKDVIYFIHFWNRISGIFW